MGYYYAMPLYKNVGSDNEQMSLRSYAYNKMDVLLLTRSSILLACLVLLKRGLLRENESFLPFVIDEVRGICVISTSPVVGYRTIPPPSDMVTAT